MPAMRISGLHKTRRSHRSGERGFTLIELMTAITVLGILLAIGVPSFTEIIRSNQLVAQTNEFVGALNLARSEALKRVASVTTCPTTNNTTCAGSTNWSTGYMVFFDANANGARDGVNDTLLQVYPVTTNSIVISSPTLTFVRYTPVGMSAHPASAFSILRSGCVGNKARNIAISTTGRLTTTTVACP